MDLSRSGIPLSIRSLFPWGREHLCYPRYNPAITGECCPKANPGPRVIIHRDYRAHRIPAEIFFVVTEGVHNPPFFSISLGFDRVRMNLSFVPFCFRLLSILSLVRIRVCFKDRGIFGDFRVDSIFFRQNHILSFIVNRFFSLFCV